MLVVIVLNCSKKAVLIPKCHDFVKQPQILDLASNHPLGHFWLSMTMPVTSGNVQTSVPNLMNAAEWDEAYSAELSSSQQESDEMAEACDLMCETPPESPRASDQPHWWMNSLSEALSALGRHWPSCPNQTLQVVTGCAGCSAEAAVLKARPAEPAASLPIPRFWKQVRNLNSVHINFLVLATDGPLPCLNFVINVLCMKLSGFFLALSLSFKA